MMSMEEYAALMKEDEENRQKHPCCENCRYFYTEAGADFCRYWEVPEEDVKNSKCWKWC